MPVSYAYARGSSISSFPQRQRKCYLHAFLDDHSRLIPHAQFYWRESLPALEDCFRQALVKHGIPSLAYYDYVPWHIIRDEQLRDARKILESPDVGAQPIPLSLGPGCFGVGMTARAPDSEEDLGRLGVTASRVF